MHPSRRERIDYIPYIMISLPLIFSVVLVLSVGLILKWQHYLGLIFLGYNALLFYKNHKKGVLFLGLTLILGIMGWLAFQPAIVAGSMHLKFGDFRIPIFAGNPLLLLVFILHFIISHRYYDGILAKKYWQHINDPGWIWKNRKDNDPK